MTDDRAVSRAQQRLWILDRLGPGSAAYIVPLIHRIDGDLDVALLERSLTEVVRRHEVLRTVYRLRSRALRQVVRPAELVRVPVLDISDHEDPQAEAERLTATEARRPFDLGADSMIRPLLLRLAPDRHRLCLTLHHIACDGWSLHILHSELSACYRSWHAGTVPELPPLREQYADFAEEQAAQLGGPSLQPASDYWRKRLADVPASVTIPPDLPRPSTRSFAGGHVRFAVERSVGTRINALARACRATPFTVFLAAFAALVRLRGGGSEAVIGTPVTNRQRESHQRLIGMFVNTAVLRLEVPEGVTFQELVHRARDESRKAIVHQALPFEMLVEELNPVRDPAFNPLFQLMLGYQEGELPGLVLPGCQTTADYGDTSTAKLDVSLSITHAAGHYSGRLEYSSDLFKAASAHSLAEQFQALLASATADPLQSLD
ncbi:condensation domain-containing protein [Streptomyces sp. NBC_01614]|uniref:condensation domain-containing protein n=1 Tax=Streptomyces sp. NBC_01614 TaxID=2975897 RepID=UPI00386F9D49